MEGGKCQHERKTTAVVASEGLLPNAAEEDLVALG